MCEEKAVRHLAHATKAQKKARRDMQALHELKNT